MRICLVTRERTRLSDAIWAHSHMVARALCELGNEAEVVERTRDGRWHQSHRETRVLSEAICPFDLTVLAYNPFLWGRRGIAPWLVRELHQARRRNPARRLALLVHEPYVAATGPRAALHAAYLRAQLEAMRVGADVVLTSIEAWASALGRWLPRRPTTHVPSGSVLPDRRTSRDAARARLGVSPTTLVVSTLSSGHPSHLPELVAATANALTPVGDMLLLVLGEGAQAPTPSHEIPVVHPGMLSVQDLADHLSASDMFLSPLDDGVSTRRTSVMAALQHGLPIVGTLGHLTDSVLEQTDGLLLAPVGDPEAFIAAALTLASDPGRRSAIGQAGRRLFEERFTPERIAAQIVAACVEESPAT